MSRESEVGIGGQLVRITKSVDVAELRADQPSEEISDPEDNLQSLHVAIGFRYGPDRDFRMPDLVVDVADELKSATYLDAVNLCHAERNELLPYSVAEQTGQFPHLHPG